MFYSVRIPSIEEIPETKKNFLCIFTAQELYGPDYSSKNKCEVYTSCTNSLIIKNSEAKSKSFLRVKELWDEKKQLVLKLGDGPRRIKHGNGDESFGSCSYSTDGISTWYYRLIKYRNGRCCYIESLLDKEQKKCLKFNFHELSLTWTKI